MAWQQQNPAYLQQDTDTVFEVHRPDYDCERSIATLQIVGFIREEDFWRRVDEEHRERGYTLSEIKHTPRPECRGGRLPLGGVRSSGGDRVG